MTLNEIHPGERFMLCRSRRIYTSTGQRTGDKNQRIVVTDVCGRVTDFNRQCEVKLVVRYRGV